MSLPLEVPGLIEVLGESLGAVFGSWAEEGRGIGLVSRFLCWCLIIWSEMGLVFKSNGKESGETFFSG